MSEINTYFKRYHKDRYLSLSKDIKCKDCENSKEFIEKDNTLIYNCGGESKSSCGDQFKIILPVYIDYDIEKKKLLEIINGSMEFDNDIGNIFHYNLKKLKEYTDLDISKELKDQEDNMKESKELLNEYTKKYKLLNLEKEYRAMIQEYYRAKQHTMIERSQLKKKLIEEEDIKKKKEYRKRYAQTCYEDKVGLLDLLQKLNINKKSDIEIEEGKVIKYHKNYKKK